MVERIALAIAALLCGCMKVEHEASAVSWAGSLGEAACTAETDTRKLNVLDWSSADRGLLEEKLANGPVVVSFTGCELAIVPGCSIGDGRYRWHPYGRKDERIEVRDLDELRARLPLGATRLVGALQHHGSLSGYLTLIGLWMLEPPAEPHVGGECAGATHVIVGVHAGAFGLVGGAQHRSGAGWQGDDGELAGERRRQVVTLQGDGDPARCVAGDGAAPPPGCKALVRIELAPLPIAHAPASAPAAEPSCPSGMALVDRGSVGWQSVPAFCIDRHEVTVRAWAECVATGDCPDAPRVPDVDGGSKRAQEIAADLCTMSDRGQLDHPVNCVTQYDAELFCRSRGASLPSDPQWVRAAIGEHARRFPWGDAPLDGARANACGRECSAWFRHALKKSRRRAHDDDDGFVATAPVGSFPAGRNDDGVEDLAGNVAEWTASIVDGDRVAVRGGSFLDSAAAALRVGDRTATDPTRRDVTIGFRCVADPLTSVAPPP